MKTKTTENGLQTAKILSFICPLIYFASYMTRKNYAVVMAELLAGHLMTESQAGLIETMALISYGAGQVICGILGDKVKPNRLISLGLGLTSLMNLAMPFCIGSKISAIVWFVNGFAQSMLWPPLVRIMAGTMQTDTYNRVCVNVNVAGISATILLYLSASLIWIRYFTWKYVFFASAIICLAILSVWIVAYNKSGADVILTAKHKKMESTAKAKKAGKISSKLLISSGFLLIAVAIICQGALRDGVTDWAPTFIIETFRLESKSAILKSVLIPIFGVISLKIVGIINEKFVKDEVKAGGITFGIAVLCCIALLIFYDKNQYVTLVAAATITALMHGVNFFLICIVPARFEKYGIVSTMSGITNSMTYVGAAAALYGFGAITEHFGWNETILITWCIVAIVGTSLALIAIRPWKKFRER